ncbi:hypothetical protein H671_2g5553 [Cricetulus griseus]|nr:hypothetical protein H671_2g5553 [Cricetulus griseus]
MSRSTRIVTYLPTGAGLRRGRSALSLLGHDGDPKVAALCSPILLPRARCPRLSLFERSPACKARFHVAPGKLQTHYAAVVITAVCHIWFYVASELFSILVEVAYLNCGTTRDEHICQKLGCAMSLVVLCDSF